MNRLILTVGLPRCGKSTWAKEQRVPVVNPDSIRLALHGQAFIGDAEPMVWTLAKYMVRALFLAGHDVVILDATNTTLKRREEWKSLDWECAFKTFSTPLDTCKERAVMTGQERLIPIIDRMAEHFEPLTSAELEYLWKS